MTKISLLIIFASLLWSSTMFKSGWIYSYGMGFWGANGHDGIWHIALANNFVNFNFTNPVFAGENIANYHVGFDLFLAFLNRLTFIPIPNLYFQILPIIFAILIGYLVYKFVLLWTGSFRSALFSVIYSYFGGSMAWMIGKGESAFWSAESISTLINPPFALSLIILLGGLIFLLKKNYVPATLFFGLLIFVKVYAGLLILVSLGVVGFYNFVIKRNFTFLKIFFAAFILSLIFYLPFNKISTSLIEFQPFWFLETMMGYSDRLGWQRFYSAITTYKMGDIYFKEIAAYGLAFVIFIIGNFWTRLIFIKDLFKKLDSVKVIMLTTIFTAVMIPMFFVQRGTPWNTIQFIYYSLFFSGILAGISIKKFNTWTLALIFLLTIPTTLITLKDVYLPNRPPAKLSNEEIEALKFLRNEAGGIVLTYPYDADKAKEAIVNPPRPLYLYESTAYVSAFSQKQVFLEDEVNLNITGYDWKRRREAVLDWIKESDSKKAKKFLKDNNIKYVYLIKPQRAFLGEEQLGLVKIFENEQTIIYKYE